MTELSLQVTYRKGRPFALLHALLRDRRSQHVAASLRAAVPSTCRSGGSFLGPTSTAIGRRRADRAGPAPSVIGPGAHFRGDLASEGPVEVHGTLEWDGPTSADCFVHEGARVLGNIAAGALVVAGEIEAGLLTAEKVEVRSTARVRATIRARVVGIQDGAFFRGQIDKT